MNNTIETLTNESVIPSFVIPAAFRFWSYLVLTTTSVLFSLFILYYLIFDHALRTAMHNHAIIIILLIDLIYLVTDLPWILYSTYTGHPMFSSHSFYLLWAYIDYSFYSTQVALFTWATVERHILIFHSRWLSNKVRRVILHYLPIIVIPTYCFIYYAFVYFGSFCTNSFDSLIAGGILIPCAFDRTFLGSWDLIFHQLVPTSVIVIFSFGLIIRVVTQKRRLNRAIYWKKHRKMIIQLLSISCIYILFNLPWIMLVFAFQYGMSPNLLEIPMMYANYLFYYLIFTLPIVCCGSLPELRDKFTKKLLCCFRHS